jgi:5-formaminoimidazole-4-carboxamide-1-(beta)-D-ribofuranosyl 5'-monophosphate synthetase
MINMPREQPTIATLGSHCSLQVLKGAKAEGFRTLLVAEKSRISLYKRFPFIDDIFVIEKSSDILSRSCQHHLDRANSILIPHGTLIAYMDIEQIEKIMIPIFGNKWILRWEADRFLKQRLMEQAKLLTPKIVKSKNDIDRLCIVKLHGAAGGRGYFLAWNKESFEENATKLMEQNIIEYEDDLFIQEYVMGIPTFLHYFFSPLSQELELLGVDRRYESDIDGLGRIPAKQQLGIDHEISYNVIGNIPLVLRESLLLDVYEMGQNFVEVAKVLAPPGMNGPFCLEGAYDKEGKFIAFEFSARIVAGTNLYVDGSPYSTLIHNEPMSMGRRISREIKIAHQRGLLDKVVT